MATYFIPANAPYIREIVDRSQSIGGTQIKTSNQSETKAQILALLEKQRIMFEKKDARKKTY